ncbi:hypothetical protein AAFF_G00006920 [Aldrovandia affinis]|uniref:Uncharacterized protein n=1 Tax=Aldrovandia affinis TaxID=143900 RepID=A0AAD7TG81_9TELE|nr:hypothetical protein AAFF_G00006920 [Aldrovandia affinis]
MHNSCSSHCCKNPPIFSVGTKSPELGIAPSFSLLLGLDGVPNPDQMVHGPCPDPGEHRGLSFVGGNSPGPDFCAPGLHIWQNNLAPTTKHPPVPCAAGPRTRKQAPPPPVYTAGPCLFSWGGLQRPAASFTCCSVPTMKCKQASLALIRSTVMHSCSLLPNTE